jgi:hypothetical protein
MGILQNKYPFSRFSIFVFMLLFMQTLAGQDTNRVVQDPLFINHFGYEPEFALIPASSPYNNSVQIVFTQYTNSNALSSSFLRKLVYGGFIDETLKDKSQKNLRQDNIAGFRNATAMSFHHKIKDSTGYRGEWFIEAKNTILTSAYFTDDLFNIVFYGNASYEGRDAGLGRKFRQLAINQIQGGWYGRFGNKNGNYHGIGVKAGFVMGSQLGDFDLEGKLFTAPEGKYIDLTIMASGKFSDTANFSVFGMNGMGASASFQYQYGNETSVIDLEVLDIGFVSWNDQTLNIAMDTFVSYEGQDIGDIGGGGKIDLDSLIKYTGADVGKQKASKMLYPRLRVSYFHRFNNTKWMLGLGMEYQIGLSTFPLGYAKVVYQIEKIQMSFEGNASYGKFGGFDMGLGVQKRFADRINVLAGTNSLISLFTPSTYPGFSFYAGLGFEF